MNTPVNQDPQPMEDNAPVFRNQIYIVDGVETLCIRNGNIRDLKEDLKEKGIIAKRIIKGRPKGKKINNQLN